ncbi:MAG: hypothetical protein KF868_16235 [Acidobacteria bacterium]|nr:hypothetical protein [Acidobacteriota bacterium]MCW5968867.1 hypothetical protein [Blastocatellales bacterium]
MRVRSRDLIFVAIVVIVVGGLYYLSTKGKARAVPANPPEHLTAKTRTDCLVCHTPEKFTALEQAHRHPGKWRDERVSCFHCHTPAAGRAQTRAHQTREWRAAKTLK